MQKPSWQKNNNSTTRPIASADHGDHAFLKSICPNGNTIARLTFELAYNDIAVQHVNIKATGTTSHHRDFSNAVVWTVLLPRRMINSSNHFERLIITVLRLPRICTLIYRKVFSFFV